MVGETPAGQDAGMPPSRPSSLAERSLAASAHELQRAAGDLQKHASDASASNDQTPACGSYPSPVRS
jgi:hypothetical protein